MPSSAACTASTATAWPRGSSPRSPRSWSRKCSSRVHAGRPGAPAWGGARSGERGIRRLGACRRWQRLGVGAGGRKRAAAARLEEPPAPGMRLGARVRHGKFGEGVVLNVKGQGAHARVQVNFEGHQVADVAIRQPRAGEVTLHAGAPERVSKTSSPARPTTTIPSSASASTPSPSFPPHLRASRSAILVDKAIVDATADLVCAYKPQFARATSPRCAPDQLEETIRYIEARAPGVPVILDSKRGDIGNTAHKYALEAFERYAADAVTVNLSSAATPCSPSSTGSTRASIVLCRTSNPGAQFAGPDGDRRRPAALPRRRRTRRRLERARQLHARRRRHLSRRARRISARGSARCSSSCPASARRAATSCSPCAAPHAERRQHRHQFLARHPLRRQGRAVRRRPHATPPPRCATRSTRRAADGRRRPVPTRPSVSRIRPRTLHTSPGAHRARHRRRTVDPFRRRHRDELDRRHHPRPGRGRRRVPADLEHGRLILADPLLGLEGDAADRQLIVIRARRSSVCWHYRQRLWDTALSLGQAEARCSC